MKKRKVWVEPLFAEAKDWHGMRRFRLRRLWRVNCEALVTASGQNLKRLLQKRGWGRRPFPTEAAAIVPPSWEPDDSPRDKMLTSQRPSIAVASLVTRGATRAFSRLQTSCFYLFITIYIIFLFFWVSYTLKYYFTIYGMIYVCFLLQEILSSVKLICFLRSSTRSFSTG